VKSLLPIALLLALVAALVLLLIRGPGPGRDPAASAAPEAVGGLEPAPRAVVDLNLAPELASSGRVFDTFYGERAAAARSQAQALGFVPEEAGLVPFDPAWNEWVAEQVAVLEPFGVPGDLCQWPGFEGKRKAEEFAQSGTPDFAARARARPGFWLLEEFPLEDQRLAEIDQQSFEWTYKVFEDALVLNDLARAALRTILAEGSGLWVPGPAEIAWQLRWPGAGDPASPWVLTLPYKGWTFLARFEGASADEIQQYKRLVERNLGRRDDFVRQLARGEDPYAGRSR
jgi:hypothetical protein